jgi:hypothetical protein
MMVFPFLLVRKAICAMQKALGKKIKVKLKVEVKIEFQVNT